jgi:tetratricopeptide (TPR) repeat protein
MRGLVIIAVLIGATAIARADAPRARAANTRGYALHKQKKYKEAAVEYRKAIAEDPSYLLAHYNLACVASLLADSETALRQLAWVADRAAWDPAARSAAEKARTDRDLEWLRKDGPDATVLTSADTLDDGILDLLGSPEPELAGKESSDARLLAALAAAPGRHDEKCSKVAFSAPFDRQASATVAATLRDGLAVIDPSGKVVARSEPIGCTAPGQHVTLLNQAAAVSRGAPDTDTALMTARVAIIMYWASARQNVTIFMINDKKQLTRAFDAVALSSTGDGSLHQTKLLGNLVYTAPGAKTPRVFRLDRASWKYVEEK